MALMTRPPMSSGYAVRNLDRKCVRCSSESQMQWTRVYDNNWISRNWLQWIHKNSYKTHFWQFEHINDCYYMYCMSLLTCRSKLLLYTEMHVAQCYWHCSLVHRLHNISWNRAIKLLILKQREFCCSLSQHSTKAAFCFSQRNLRSVTVDRNGCSDTAVTFTDRRIRERAVL